MSAWGRQGQGQCLRQTCWVLEEAGVSCSRNATLTLHENKQNCKFCVLDHFSLPFLESWGWARGNIQDKQLLFYLGLFPTDLSPSLTAWLAPVTLMSLMFSEGPFLPPLPLRPGSPKAAGHLRGPSAGSASLLPPLRIFS